MKKLTFINSLFLIFFLFPMLSVAADPATHKNFLVISDIHLDQSSTHTMEINPAKISKANDLDLTTFKKLMSDITANINNGTVSRPDFVLVLGDILGHARTTHDNVISNEKTVFKTLKESFPTTPILYTFGNNDSISSNYGSFTDHDNKEEAKSAYDVAKNVSWADGFLSTGTQCATTPNTYPCVINENKTDGYYSANIEKQVRLLSLNSVMFSPDRVDVTDQDVNAQFKWLENELKSAEKTNEHVIITMHIPPGYNIYDHSAFWKPELTKQFLTLVDNYQHTIIGILASHTHTEELKVIKDTNGKIISGLYLTPALSTSHGNAPAVKTFYLNNNDRDWQLSDYDVFNFTQTESETRFSKLYDYRSYYCKFGDTKRLLECINDVNIEKLIPFYSAGNRNYETKINSPADLVLMTE